MTEPWAEDLLAFWFGLRPEQWWKADPELDAEVKTRFHDIWAEQKEQLPGAFLDSPAMRSPR